MVKKKKKQTRGTRRGSGSVTITVSLAQEEVDLFNTAAEAYDMSRSEFFRHVLRLWHDKYRSLIPKKIERTAVIGEDSKTA